MTGETQPVVEKRNGGQTVNQAYRTTLGEMVERLCFSRYPAQLERYLLSMYLTQWHSLSHMFLSYMRDPGGPQSPGKSSVGAWLFGPKPLNKTEVCVGSGAERAVKA